MTPTLTTAELEPITAELASANGAFIQRYPGESNRRQAVHVVYGGAHLFKSDTAQKLGAVALRVLDDFAPDSDTLNEALDVPWSRMSAVPVYERVVAKLQREAVEDFRLDFEDGYGNREDAEEDGHAASSADQVAAGFAAGTLPPFIGIRVKPFNEDNRARSMRTLDIFITSLVAKAGGELMVETPQAIIDRDGRCPLLGFIESAEGRCSSVHFGVYDYTASFGITAAYQAMGHPACDFARTAMVVALAGTGVHISDGATNILPVGPHRGTELSADQIRENRDAVHGAWKRAFDDNLHSLRNGIYQGWDLHPAQFIVRYAAVYSFFLEGLVAASSRLKAFVEKAALASLHGDVFDDAATGQGLLNFFLRGIACGAITETEALATGLTLDGIRSRSFLKILQARRK